MNPHGAQRPRIVPRQVEKIVAGRDLSKPPALPTQIPAVPELYKPFDVSKYLFGPTPGPSAGKLYMIGCVKVA